ncbi:hypothetical protein NP493_426g04009 [Ridgeia piscesae]|uniref:Uncharacterized protein n=1 Tax=Ridgeia piscesae TaxID=27915 RepID=A0AAD9L0H5_RIDPI|nr:hypothetical protein NP493_426g04009 [Ridgeia piscesae]
MTHFVSDKHTINCRVVHVQLADKALSGRVVCQGVYVWMGHIKQTWGEEMNIQAKCFSLASTTARRHVHTLGLTLSLLSRLSIDVLHFVTKKKKYEAKRYIAYRCKHHGSVVSFKLEKYSSFVLTNSFIRCY